MKFLYTYLAIINALSFLLMLIDKQKAIRGMWRISEATLLGSAAIGGSLGAFLGMHLFRHKTRHGAFYIGIPIMMVIHIILLIIIL